MKKSLISAALVLSLSAVAVACDNKDDATPSPSVEPAAVATEAPAAEVTEAPAEESMAPEAEVTEAPAEESMAPAESPAA